MESLRAQMAEVGLDPGTIALTEITGEEQARSEHFPGSPTIRIGGDDIDDAGERFGLGCRVYTRPDGRISPLPAPERIAAALATGISSSEENV